MKTKHPFFPIPGTLLVLFLALSAAFPAQGQSRQDIAKKDLLKQGNRMYNKKGIVFLWNIMIYGINKIYTTQGTELI